MWICMNNAFLSIVDKATKPGCLVVRARRREHIHFYFPKAEILKNAGTDYQYRAEIDRKHVAEVISNAVAGIDYPNFKNSVSNSVLHRVYNQIWNAVAVLGAE